MSRTGFALWPRTLRAKLLLLLVPLLVLSIGGLSHVLTLAGEESILNEKRVQLEGGCQPPAGGQVAGGRWIPDAAGRFAGHSGAA